MGKFCTIRFYKTIAVSPQQFSSDECLKLLSWGHIKVSQSGLGQDPDRASPGGGFPLGDTILLLVYFWALGHRPVSSRNILLKNVIIYLQFFFHSVITSCSDLQTTKKSQSMMALPLNFLKSMCFVLFVFMCFIYTLSNLTFVFVSSAVGHPRASMTSVMHVNIARELFYEVTNSYELVQCTVNHTKCVIIRKDQ